MRPVRVLATLLAIIPTAVSARPARAPSPPAKSSLAALLAGPPVTPGGTLRNDADGRLRTLELDDLAPIHLRLTVRF